MARDNDTRKVGGFSWGGGSNLRRRDSFCSGPLPPGDGVCAGGTPFKYKMVVSLVVRNDTLLWKMKLGIGNGIWKWKWNGIAEIEILNHARYIVKVPNAGMTTF